MLMVTHSKDAKFRFVLGKLTPFCSLHYEKVDNIHSVKQLLYKEILESEILVSTALFYYVLCGVE